MLRRRLAICCVLVAVLGGLFVHHGATADAHDPYPALEELDADYDSHVGQKAVLAGRVVATDPANGTMTVTPPRTTLLGEMTVTGVDQTVQPGGTIHVYGTLESGHRIAAENIVVVNRSSGGEWYKYGASVVGAALILGLFFREWRIDRETLAFEVRRDG